MKTSRRNFTELFLRSFVLIILLTAAGLVSITTAVITTTSNRALQKYYNAYLSLFVENISNDILTGRHFEVSRKCREVYSNEDIAHVEVIEANGQIICNLEKPTTERTSSVSSVIYFDSSHTEKTANVRLTFHSRIITDIFASGLMLLLPSLCLVMLGLYLISRKRIKSIGLDFANATQNLHATNQFQFDELYALAKRTKIDELHHLLLRIAELGSRLESVKEQEVRHARELSQFQLASQVAHDIRSPLSALEVTLSKIDLLPEDDRIIIRSAVGRIKDIANNLLSRNLILNQKTSDKELSETSDELSISLLSSLIEPLVTEKRIQFNATKDICIEVLLEPTSYGLFAIVQTTELKRVISNLIDNAVQSLEGSGNVSITLRPSNSDQVTISVHDTGRGIPPEMMARIGIRGETYGKKNGSGLGLYHAKSNVERWGGHLKVESEAGKGTIVSIHLPKASPPKWFAAELSITPDTDIVVLDDDRSIHVVWQSRFDLMGATERGIKIHHLSSPSEFREWVSSDVSRSARAIYLSDYELRDQQATGLSLISKFELAARSFLVTSRFEDPDIIEACQGLGLRLIPKGLVGMLPIIFRTAREVVDAILLDDEELVHMTWEYQAKRSGKVLKTYRRSEDFFADADRFDRSTPIYVDVNLEGSLLGDEVARLISELGFTEIHLSTGDPSDKYSSLVYIRSVRSKSPPWEADK